MKRDRLLPLNVVRGAAQATVLLLLLLLSNGAGLANPATAPRPIDFNRDIRPIFSENCYACHGPDKNKRKAGLRLDRQEVAFAKLDSGAVTIVPGDSSRSELIHRITSPADDERMPPPKTGKRLTKTQIDLLNRWIAEGADWKPHWAYITPVRPPLPPVHDPKWTRDEIDYFILARLEQEGLKPSPEADRRTLIRRVSFDLIGLPPTPEEVKSFLKDNRPNAYERVVDRLLASPHYGERMAQDWLDLARYADSDGYNDDYSRVMWQYRDYVINAFNQNKPFDQFTIEQLAGDLLPHPTLEQKIATGFNRNNMTTTEGGADPEEYLTKYAKDRVNTTATVWLGSTMGCCECHDHKYDPFTQKEYYQIYDFFSRIPEKGLDRDPAPPFVKTPTPAQTKELGRLDALIAPMASARPRPESGENPEGRTYYCDYYSGDLTSLITKLSSLQNERAELDAAIPTIRVMEDAADPKPTFLLMRGDYRNHGEQVNAGVPKCLPPLPADKRTNRLSFANWLVDPQNPLVARVAVNRYWQHYFGRGIVKTANDFGTQGELPSHQELLDWLAREFVESGWNVKNLQRKIVMSATYRQSSKPSPQMLARDPGNQLLTRGPRFRLPVEEIRDNALSIAGLLDRDRKPGGPSVKPYQPEGLWQENASNNNPEKYVVSAGPDLYRRSLYTFWRRSVLNPSFKTFDAPEREICSVQRETTTTPLQAFVTLNEVTYLEAARVAAQRILQNGGANERQQMRYAFEIALSRPPKTREARLASDIYQDLLAYYKKDRPAALELVNVGAFPRPAQLDTVRLAAWTGVANMILNLDESLTRE